MNRKKAVQLLILIASLLGILMVALLVFLISHA